MTVELKDFQLDVGGVVIGHGTSVPIAEIQGLGRAGVRGEVVPQPDSDGAWLGPDWYEARAVRIDCAIKTPGDAVAAMQILADLEAVADEVPVRTVGGAVMPLRIKWPGAPVRVLYGRLRKVEPTLEKAALGWVPLDMEFVAPGARFHSDVEQQARLRLGWLSGGGFKAPVQAPIRVTSADPSGQSRRGWVTNNGDVNAHPVLTVHGPCANPEITHVETGRTISVPVTLTTGQWVRVDTRPGQIHIVRDNGGSAPCTSRLDTFVLPPGRSELRWTASDPTATARLTATWRDTYISLHNRRTQS